MTPNENLKSILIYVVILIVHFFATIYITVPIVQSIWNMLVYPNYNIKLASGLIIFVSLIRTIKISTKTTEEKGSPLTVTTTLASFYLSMCFTWCLAKAYTFFI